MKLINAREAAKIARATREEFASMRANFAECCVREDIMPYIVEEVESGRNAVVVEIALNSDAYNVRDLILSILVDLGYNVKVEENGRKFNIKW